MAETKNCTKGYGITHNNCFGVKNGNTAPCPGVPKMAMCKYDTPEESYEAFIKIWQTHYKIYPDMRLARIWSGNDRAESWLSSVNYYYNQ